MQVTEPNTSLQAIRDALLMSQDELARAVREAGDKVGEPNDCSKRLIQRWESGEVKAPRPVYLRALEVATGQPVENLFPGYTRRQALGLAAAGAAVIPLGETNGGAQSGPLTGIWLSRYEYVSSGRGGETFSSSHYVMLLHRGARLQVRSLPGTAEGQVSMDLTVKENRVTGSWAEQTDKSGYYAGSSYDGAIQMIIDPTGHRMSGQWVGFTRDFQTQTGPWSLTLVTTDTDQAAVVKYNRPVED